MKDIGTRTPINKTSAMVVSEGEHWNPEVPKSCAHDSEFPIPFSYLPHGAKNLSGLRSGRLTVIGYYGRNKTGYSGTAARHRWVVRCDCGMYSVRRATSLLKHRSRHDDDCCDRCKHLDRIKRY